MCSLALIVSATVFLSLPVQSNPSSSVTVMGTVQGGDYLDLQDYLYQNQSGTKIEFSSVSPPISKNIVNELIYNSPIDIVGLPPSAVSRVNGAGWLVDLSSDTRFTISASETYKNIASTLRHNGKLVALGQVASTHAIPLIDMTRYEELGMEREVFPRNWDQLYSQLFAMADQGGTDLFLPYWYSGRTGLSVGFTAEVLNRGGSILHPITSNVAMAENYGAAYDTLVMWRELLKRGIVDPEILSMNESDYVDLYLNTDYVFAMHKSDFFVTLLDKDRKESKTITLPPRHDHSWGVLSANLFSIVDRAKGSVFRKNVQKNFLLKSTYDAKENGLYNAQQWVEQTGYFSVYQEQMEGKEMLESVKAMLYYPEDAKVLLDIYKHAPTPKGLWKAVWYDEFNGYLNSQLLMYLRTPEMKAEQVIRNLNERIVFFQSQYQY